ncbi:hypothetical protein BDZ85DRAFT_13570 [Elsinoe ampelina]|uniref:Uncharacterized protein n=1 Tax=Elsinoe ampelina TaxID=302913 RepID=A0A6A6GR84_9PEZI|nr:hypothetical protein BDZ85DRAFT_13570 [Elsinoe ampelina]
MDDRKLTSAALHTTGKSEDGGSMPGWGWKAGDKGREEASFHFMYMSVTNFMVMMIATFGIVTMRFGCDVNTEGPVSAAPTRQRALEIVDVCYLLADPHPCAGTTANIPGDEGLQVCRPNTISRVIVYASRRQASLHTTLLPRWRFLFFIVLVVTVLTGGNFLLGRRDSRVRTQRCGTVYRGWRCLLAYGVCWLAVVAIILACRPA